MSESYQRAKDLFLEAVELPAGEREAPTAFLVLSARKSWLPGESHAH